jgi:hypothetical protein
VAVAAGADTVVAAVTVASGEATKRSRSDGLPKPSLLGKFGQGWIRTSEGVSQQIYSLPRLATSVPTLSWAEDSPRRGCARERQLSMLIRKIQRSR